MRILIATPISLNVGMAQWTLVEFARAFAVDGHEVVLADGTTTFGNHVLHSDAEIEERLAPAHRLRVPSLRLSARALPLPSLAGIRQLSRAVARSEVVLVSQYYGSDALLFALARLRRRPFVYLLGNTLERPRIRGLKEWGHRLYMATVGRRLTRSAADVRVCNRDDAASVRAMGQPAVHLVYPPIVWAVEPDPRPPSGARETATFHVVMSGRASVQKGFDVAAQATHALVDALPEGAGPIEVHLVGTPQFPPEFLAMPADPRLRLVHHGPVPPKEVMRLLAGSHLALVPSRYESFGRIAMEAQAQGRVVVATDVTGLREIVVDGVNGYLAPVGDASALARAMRTAWETWALRPEVWREMERAARDHYETRFGDAVLRQQLDAWIVGLESIARDRAPRSAPSPAPRSAPGRSAVPLLPRREPEPIDRS
jgi:glycosyltransferase involved in cell wall biosynthesis